MAEAGQTRTCPACAETIKAAARICPHCRTKQTRFALFWQEAPGLGAGVLLLAVFIGTVVWMAPDDWPEGRSFSGRQADLKVGGLRLEPRKTETGFRITGVVTNQGRYPWRVREIEVSFRAKDGGLIDTSTALPNPPFVVQPGGEGAFSDALPRLHPDAPTARLEARVRLATDGNKPLKPD